MHVQLFITLKMENLVTKRNTVEDLANTNKEDRRNLHAIRIIFIFERNTI